MRIGVCCGPNEWPLVSSLGYDYVEANFSWIASIDHDTFRGAAEKLDALGLRAETFNGFFPPIALYETSDEWIADYAGRTFARCATLGGEIAVLGSGGARKVTEGMTLADAEERFVRVLRICGDAAQANGMKLIIEPLRRKECNFINTLTESVALCRRADHPAVGTLLDFFHFFANGETVDEIPDAAPYLWHTHLARPNIDRNAPSEADVDAMRPWADALRGIGYKGRMSLECAWQPGFTEAVTSAFPVMDLFRSV